LPFCYHVPHLFFGEDDLHIQVSVGGDEDATAVRVTVKAHDRVCGHLARLGTALHFGVNEGVVAAHFDREDRGPRRRCAPLLSVLLLLWKRATGDREAALVAPLWSVEHVARKNLREKIE
jgi:hypothetical protein